jgi:K+-sensing histidine kinase KdpD
MGHRRFRFTDNQRRRLAAEAVRQPEISPQDQAALDKNLEIAREVGATIHVLDGRDSVRALIQFARSIQVRA